MRAAESGHQVVGVDPDEAKMTSLRAGVSYVEDVPSEQLRQAVAAGTFRPAEFLTEGFDYAVITVPTPLRDGVPDISYVESAAEAIAKNMTAGCTVILESTSYPGTTEQVVLPILERISGLYLASEDFYLGCSPERIDPGNPAWTFTTTPKLVSGANGPSMASTYLLYNSLCDTVVPVPTPAVAELAKVFENLFRSVNIALVNELAQVSHGLGVNVWDVLDAADSKPFGFMKFQPGPGTGGHCLPIDPAFLSWKVERDLGHTFRFVKLAEEINSHMPDYVVERAAELLNDRQQAVKGSKVLVLGLAYKRGSSDVRESPSHKVVSGLKTRGARVLVFDPVVEPWARWASSTREGLQDHPDYGQFDLVLMLTNHDEFDYARIGHESQLILDTRHVFPATPNVVYL